MRKKKSHTAHSQYLWGVNPRSRCLRISHEHFANRSTSRPQFSGRASRPSKRRFHSAAIEAAIAQFQNTTGDGELGWLFENCFSNTLDTTVTPKTADPALISSPQSLQ